MSLIHLRSGGGTEKCSQCDRIWDVRVDGVHFCEDCLAALVRGKDPEAARVHEARQLEGELARLTGRRYRNLKDMPSEAISDLRRVVRDLDDAKRNANSKLRRFGLPGV